MKFLASIIAYWVCASVALAPAQLLTTPEPESLIVAEVAVEHVGPATVSDQFALANIRLKAGDTFNELSVNEDTRSLYATGYFDSVRVNRQEVGPGQIKLIYYLQGKPILTDINFTGNSHFSDNKLRGVITSKVERPLDGQALFADARAIEEKYQTAGFHDVRVEVEQNVSELAGRGAANFVIEEGAKIKVVDVVFTGTTFEQKRLRKVMKTRRKGFWSWLSGTGKLKREDFDEDQDRLRTFFREQGYLDFEIRDVEMDFVDEDRMVVRFDLFQGEQYDVGAVRIQGNQAIATETLMEDLPMAANTTYRPSGKQENRSAIREAYNREGYVDAGIRLVENPNLENGAIDLDYQISEGEQNFIERIEIRGNDRTKDRVIRRELAVSPGEKFNMFLVERSRERIERLNLFEEVSVDPIPTDIATRKDLRVSVTEKNTGRINFGAGFSTVDNVVGYAELVKSNFDIGQWGHPWFTGGGQKLRIRAQVGTRRQDYVLNFIEPWFLGRRLIFNTELFHQQLNFNSNNYDEQRTGGRLSLTSALFNDDRFRGTVSYGLERVELQFDDVAGVSRARADELEAIRRSGVPFTAAEQADAELARNNLSSDLVNAESGDRMVSRLGLGIAFDNRRGDPIFPDYGTLTRLDTELAGGPFGFDTDYYRVELRSNWHYPSLVETYQRLMARMRRNGNRRYEVPEFFEGHTFAFRFRTGVVDSFGDSNRVPLFDRFFLGGQYDLRGYDFREVGPRDNPFNNEPIGGGTFWFGSAEYTIPIVEQFRVAAFYDAGNVYQDSWDFGSFGDYSDDWGIGIRIATPLGPLRLDYALPLTDSDGLGRSGGRFNFSVSTVEN